MLDRKHKLHWKWGHIVSYVAHQYSRVDFYSSLEVNLSLYYGGVINNIRCYQISHYSAALLMPFDRRWLISFIAVVLMTQTHKRLQNWSGRITKTEVADFWLFLFYDIFEQTQCMELNQNGVLFKMVDRLMRTITIVGGTPNILVGVCHTFTIVGPNRKWSWKCIFNVFFFQKKT